MNNRSIETMFGEDLFTYDSWDMIDYNELKYYNVEFPFDSMKEFNGYNVIKADDGELRILAKNGNNENIIWSGFVIDIDEFRELLFNRYK